MCAGSAATTASTPQGALSRKPMHNGDQACDESQETEEAQASQKSLVEILGRAGSATPESHCL
jgi:hypothetical protein